MVHPHGTSRCVSPPADCTWIFLGCHSMSKRFPMWSQDMECKVVFTAYDKCAHRGSPPSSHPKFPLFLCLNSVPASLNTSGRIMLEPNALPSCRCFSSAGFWMEKSASPLLCSCPRAGARGCRGVGALQYGPGYESATKKKHSLFPRLLLKLLFWPWISLGQKYMISQLL